MCGRSCDSVFGVNKTCVRWPNSKNLTCKFDLDQSERRSSQVHATPGQTETKVFKLRLFASPFDQTFRKMISSWCNARWIKIFVKSVSSSSVSRGLLHQGVYNLEEKKKEPKMDCNRWVFRDAVHISRSKLSVAIDEILDCFSATGRPQNVLSQKSKCYSVRALQKSSLLPWRQTISKALCRHSIITFLWDFAYKVYSDRLRSSAKIANLFGRTQLVSVNCVLPKK